MKDKNKCRIPCCPGCSKHCPMGCERCKHGKNYFAKRCPRAESVCPICKKSGKWKNALEKGGLIFFLLKTAKRIKKELKAGRTDETRLLSRLTPSEKEALESILKKLETAVSTK